MPAAAEAMAAASPDLLGAFVAGRSLLARVQLAVARGDVLRDEEGYWAARSGLDWSRLPARVEAVIAERIDRLPAGLRELLRVTSVEGEEFTAEVAAAVLEQDAADLVRRLSHQLDREQNLVRAVGMRHDGNRRPGRHALLHSAVWGDESRRGQPGAGLELTRHALEMAVNHDEGWGETAVRLTLADLLWQASDPAAAEAQIRLGLAKARSQQARFFELRAALHRHRLGVSTGSGSLQAEARAAVATVYAWFGEGLELPLLAEARRLLEASRP